MLYARLRGLSCACNGWSPLWSMSQPALYQVEHRWHRALFHEQLEVRGVPQPLRYLAVRVVQVSENTRLHRAGLHTDGQLAPIQPVRAERALLDRMATRADWSPAQTPPAVSPLRR